MITKEKIQELTAHYLEDTSLFVVELRVSGDNQIMVYIDGDEGVSIEDCVDLSRHIEFSLDREEEDFALNVSSAGLDTSLKMIRQYQKYINKNLITTLSNGEQFVGRLVSASEEKIEIVPLIKNPNSKKGAPQKLVEGELKTLTLDQIEDCKIEITF